MCIISLINPYIQWPSFRIQSNLALRKIKINRTSFKTALPQNARQFIHQFKHWNQRFVFLPLCFVLFLNDFMDACVRHAAVYIDNRFLNTMLYDLTLFINIHHAGQSQTVNSLVQGTDSIGKLMRDHRNNTVYQINTGAAL